MLSTSTSENQTLPPADDVARSTPANQADINNNAMEVDITHDGEMSSPLSDVISSDVDVTTSAKPSDNVIPISKIIYAPDGTVIVETLDTPALRREKTQRRKAERLRLAAEAEAAASSSFAGPSQLPASVMRSDSSSLTDLEGNEEEEGNAPRNESRLHASVPPKDPAAIVLAEGEMLEGGTLGT